MEIEKQTMRTLKLHIKVHQNDKYFHSAGKINRQNITDIATQIQFVSIIFHGVYCVLRERTDEITTNITFTFLYKLFYFF